MELKEAIVSVKPDVKWTDIAGLNEAKKQLQEAVILPVKFPDLFKGKFISRGFLLYGPPGCGKSLMIKALARNAEIPLFTVDLYSQKQSLTNLFQLAKQSKNSIVLFDYIDLLTYSSKNEIIRHKYKQTNDILYNLQQEEGIFVFGMTNCPDRVEPSIRRILPTRIYIPLPVKKARGQLLKKFYEKNDHSITDKDFEQLGTQAEGFSGSDLVCVRRDGQYEALRELQKSKCFKQVEVDGIGQKWMAVSEGEEGGQVMDWKDIKPDELYIRKITIKDLQNALKKTKPSVGPEDIIQHVQWTKKFGQEK